MSSGVQEVCLDIQEGFIKIEDPKEIEYCFFHLSKNKNRLIIWQHIDNDAHRESVKCKILKFDREKMEVQLAPIKGIFDLNSMIKIYLYIPSPYLICKNFIYHNSPYKMTIKLPKAVLIKNKRDNPRENLLEKKQFFHFKYNFDKNTTLGERTHKSQLIDMSENGLAFKSSINNIIKFHKGNLIKVEHPNERNKFLMAEIVHITKTIDIWTNQSFFKVGVQYLVDQTV